MADININLKIPNAHVSTAWKAINALADTHMTIEARGHASDPVDKLDVRFDFRIELQKDGETNKQFAERWLSEYVRAVIKGYWLSVDNKRYREDVSAVSLPMESVDDGVIVPA